MTQSGHQSWFHNVGLGSNSIFEHHNIKNGLCEGVASHLEDMLMMGTNRNAARTTILLVSTKVLIASAALICAVPLSKPALAQQQQARPNILVIFGDDIGQSNISAYSHGLVGYKTPNIDRIAKEGMMFTDYYAENSCTAGRSTFITGQVCLRTGLCKVGIPGATVGLQDRDITIAQALKPLGYATGQFGKNHLGDPRRISADQAWVRRVLR